MPIAQQRFFLLLLRLTFKFGTIELREVFETECPSLRATSEGHSSNSRIDLSIKLYNCGRSDFV